MASRIYPLLYIPDIASRDQITLAIVGVSTEDERQYAVAEDWATIQAFTKMDDTVLAFVRDHATRWASWNGNTYDYMAKQYERQYPSRLAIGDPITSIDALDVLFPAFRSEMLRF